MQFHKSCLFRRARADNSLGLVTLAAMLGVSSLAFAPPPSLHFTAGEGSIKNNASGVVITQKSPQATIVWHSLSIERGQTVNLENGSGTTTIEVGGSGLSHIAGSFRATGSVRFVSPTGMTVTATGNISSECDIDVDTQGRVINEGTISARQGRVYLSANGNGDVIDSGSIDGADVRLKSARGNLYVLGGKAPYSIRATGASGYSADVRLGAAGRTMITGTIVARNGDGSGGNIIASGELVNASGRATLDASGTTGGTILIGGDRRGGLNKAEKLVPEKVAQADLVDVAQHVRFAANGNAGRGGSVVLWSKGTTRFAGFIEARGSAQAPGGFAEVITHGLPRFRGRVDLRSAGGQAGTLLLDPYNLTIGGTTSNASCGLGGGGETCSPTGNNAILSATTLEGFLAGANVVVTTNVTGGTQAGDLTLASGVTWSSANTLTLDSYHTLAINAAISASGNGSLVLKTNDGGSGGTLSFGTGGEVTFANPSVSTLTINGSSYTLINSTSQLITDLNATPSGNYALANNIVFPSTQVFPGAPITRLSGTLEGLGNSISNLDIVASANSGLIGKVTGSVADMTLVTPGLHVTSSGGAILLVGSLTAENTGSINNVTVVSPSITTTLGSASSAYSGGLVGESDGSGTITGSTVSGGTIAANGAVSGEQIDYNYEGGLVGWDNGGTVTGSSASDDVTSNSLVANEQNPPFNQISTIGGLVGYETDLILNSSASGSVTSTNSGTSTVPTWEAVGGLAGLLYCDASCAQIAGSNASGDVAGGSYGLAVGGLVGLNNVGTVGGTYHSSTGAFAAGDVSAGDYNDAGGLVGANDCTPGCIVKTTFATGFVSGGAHSFVGGLVGENWNSIQDSFTNYGTPDESLVQTVVSGGDNSEVGGLVGVTNTNNFGSCSTGQPMLLNSFSIGTNGSKVVGGASSAVGGLIGLAFVGDGVGAMCYGYSTEQPVGGTGSKVGGVIGNDGTYFGSGNDFTDVYWDTSTSGTTQGAGTPAGDPNLTGWTTHMFRTMMPSGFANPPWTQDTTNDKFPYLSDNPFP